MSNNMNLYYIFYEVAMTKNISKAASDLYISQPAISKAINRLESNLECKLFTRNSRGVVLTNEGEILFEQIKEAVEAIKEGEEKIKLAGELGVGRLSIGVSTTLCKHVLLPYLEKYVNKYPHVKVSISCQSSMETIQALEQDKIDIGFIGYPVSKNSLTYKPVMEIHDTFVCTKQYLDNFSMREKLTKEKLIENATFMMLNKENITRKYVDTALDAVGVVPKNVIEISNMDLLIDFAKTNLGISCVIRELVENDINNNHLKEINLIGKTAGREIGLAYLHNKIEINKCVSDFIDCFFD